MFRRIFCLISAFVVLFSLSVPAFAVGTELPVSGGIGLDVDVASLADMAFKAGVGSANFLRHLLLDNDVCPLCTDMTGQHDFQPKRTQIDGHVGVHYICKYCGKSAGEVMDTQYDEFVETLPAQVVNSDGSFLWTMSLESLRNFRAYIRFPTGNTNHYVVLDGSQRVSTMYYNVLLSTYAVPLKQIVAIYDGDFELLSFDFSAPFDGFYTLVSGGFPFESRACAQGSFYGLGNVPANNGLLNLAWPTFSVTPLTPPYEFSASQSSNRVGGDVFGAGTGLYGYVQNGELCQSSVGTIYNETTNIFQNPVTGETKDVSNWTYDYSDRSYTLTMQEGDTVEVTYGDTNVTINEGSASYTVYYLVEHDESIPEHDYRSEVTQSPTCTETGVKTYTCTDCGDVYTEAVPALGHGYIAALTLAPTCTGTGVRTYTCSRCGDSYTEQVQALGHKWQVLASVPTSYDSETGVLQVQGYTLYKCSVCGEEYRIDSESSGVALPSAGGGGVSTGGTSDDSGLSVDVDTGFFSRLASGLIKDVPEILGLFGTWFVSFPAFFKSFSDFLKACFGWLPKQISDLLYYGLGSSVFIGLTKFFRR